MKTRLPSDSLISVTEGLSAADSLIVNLLADQMTTKLV